MDIDEKTKTFMRKQTGSLKQRYKSAKIVLKIEQR